MAKGSRFAFSCAQLSNKPVDTNKAILIHIASFLLSNSRTPDIPMKNARLPTPYTAINTSNCLHMWRFSTVLDVPNNNSIKVTYLLII